MAMGSDATLSPRMGKKDLPSKPLTTKRGPDALGRPAVERVPSAARAADFFQTCKKPAHATAMM